MPKLDDLTGKSFGRLVVLHRMPKSHGNSNTRWLCLCECGTERVVAGSSLRSGDTYSCGCLRRETTAARNRTHGRSRSKVYTAWISIRDRCYNKADSRYHDYGGRGITVCRRWNDSFESFLEDVGEPPTPKHSIDREDVNGNYEPGNVRWSTPTEQANNTRSNRVYTFRGETRSLAEWARILGFKYRCLYSRVVRDGIDFEEAVSYPSRTI